MKLLKNVVFRVLSCRKHANGKNSTKTKHFVKDLRDETAEN